MLLTGLRSAAEENDQGAAIPAEIDPVAGTGAYSILKNAGTSSFCVGEVYLFHAGQRGRDSGGRGGVEAIEPPSVEAAALGIYIR